MEPSKETHRKIELDSPEDLRYLYNRLLQVTKEKLDIHFPASVSVPAITNGFSSITPSSTTKVDDETSLQIKNQAEQLLIDYLLQTFELAGKSISINGLDITDTNSILERGPFEEYEPYDRHLHDKAQSLHAQLANETLRVSELRRSVPTKVAARCQKAVQTELEIDERIFAATLVESDRDAESIEKEKEELQKQLERQEHIEKDYQKDMELLQRLRTTFPTTISKVSRAQDAAHYTASKKRKQT